MVASQAVVDLSGIRDTEQKLSELARAGGPLRRVIAGLAARLVEKQGWNRLGFARLGDYARERLGLSARSVQEFARVGARLGELPAVEGALVSGQLPWSKVRLLARFVSTEDAGAWVAYATTVGVRQLEGELRAADRGRWRRGRSGALKSDPKPLPGALAAASRFAGFGCASRHRFRSSGSGCRSTRPRSRVSRCRLATRSSG
jgi:hypothetical protein